ncbi:MAG: hypothetical protein HYU58_01075 [Proteobacteria bacterium]|nr:hypothetical protein [Pseudomonadota bacterium]
MSKRILTAVTSLCLAFVAICVGPAVADEEETVKAFSSWQGRGQIFETGPNRMTFVGAFSGMIYIETQKGPLDAGYMVCPAYVDVNVTDGTQEAKGRCTISAKDGARVYADLSCKGVHMVGCEGEFKFTGGTDRFEGITGGGPVTVRSALQDLAASGGNTVQESASGIIYWPKLTYKLKPAAQ